jgi:hypothetical protein
MLEENKVYKWNDGSALVYLGLKKDKNITFTKFLKYIQMGNKTECMNVIEVPEYYVSEESGNINFKEGYGAFLKGSVHGNGEHADKFVGKDFAKLKKIYDNALEKSLKEVKN